MPSSRLCARPPWTACEPVERPAGADRRRPGHAGLAGGAGQPAGHPRRHTTSLRECGTTIHVLAAVTGGDALRAGASDPDSVTVRFLQAVRREAADGRDRLLTMEREWREARV